MIDWLRRGNDGTEAKRDAEDHVIEIAGQVLPVVLTRRHQAKRITLRIADDASHIRISLPHWTRASEALDFANSRKDWIASALAKIPRRAAPEAGGSIEFRGQQLVVDWRPDARRKPALGEDRLIIGGPSENLIPRLQRWLEGEAQRLATSDLAEYCGIADIAEVPQLRISRARRRWGSCAADGTVRINWRLIQAPDHVRRSVVAHEVAHLVHFDHSPAFHAFFARIFEGDGKAADRWLKAHGRGLYSAFG